MKALVVFDSYFGNTGLIASAIGTALGPGEAVKVIRVDEVRMDQLSQLDLLVIGSPTRKFSSTTAIKQLLRRIPADDLHNVRVAAFDTRIGPADVPSGFLRFLIKLFGYAAEPMATKLQRKGGLLTMPPEGFLVNDTEGPLKDGELERAADWGKTIREQF